jgi:hypothetical protein
MYTQLLMHRKRHGKQVLDFGIWVKFAFTPQG